MEQGKGWKLLPISFKTLFLFLVAEVIYSVLLYGGFIFEDISLIGCPILGFYFHGISATFFAILLHIAFPAIFLFVLWNRSVWAWKYGIGYFSFFILNTLLSLVNLPNELLRDPEINSEVMYQVVYQFALIGIFFAIITDIVFLIIIYKKRSYFNKI